MKKLVRTLPLALSLLGFGCAAPIDTAGAGGQSGFGGAESESIEAAEQALNTTNWVLQLPTGSGHSPTTISSAKLGAGYSSAYYYKQGTAQIFMVPAKGITTSGSQHTRAEMRESNSGGGQAAWSPWGTNSLTVTGKVLQVGGGSKGTVAVGQTFNGTDSIPLAELMYSNSKKGFILLYEEAKGQAQITDLKVPVPLNQTYTFKMDLSGGVLKVTINGKLVYTRKPSATILNKKFYFKFGNYDQTTSAGTPTTTPYTRVAVYDAKLVHK